MNSILRLLTAAAFSLAQATALRAADGPQPLLTAFGKVIVREDFSGAGIPKSFVPLGQPKAFSVVDGALQIVSEAGQTSAPFAVVKLPAHDVAMSFSVKFTKAGMFFVAIDGHSEAFGGNTHLVRLMITPTGIVWDQKRGSPESKKAITIENKKARKDGQKIPTPTAEQLADPKYYRTEELAKKAVNFGIGEWHQVLIEISGDDLVAQVDGQGALLARATVADADKSRAAFEISGRGTVLIGNVRISEATRRADAEQVKQKLNATPKTAEPKK